mgnify:CR=1 FL=1
MFERIPHIKAVMPRLCLFSTTKGWKDVDMYVSNDNTNWVKIKEIRDLTDNLSDYANADQISIDLPTTILPLGGQLSIITTQSLTWS